MEKERIRFGASVGHVPALGLLLRCL
jgi:hypothetical protein